MTADEFKAAVLIETVAIIGAVVAIMILTAVGIVTVHAINDIGFSVEVHHQERGTSCR